MQPKGTRANANGGKEVLHPVHVIIPATQPLPNLKDSVRYLLRRTRLALKADAATVLLFDDTLLRLKPIVFDGLTELEPGFLSPLGKSIVGQIADNRNGLIFHTAGELHVISRGKRNTAKSIAGVPLRIGNRVLGVLCVASLATPIFEEQDLLILGLVAERATAAIERELVLEAEDAC